MNGKTFTRLSDSKTARWTALLIVSFTMFAGYYMADVMSPLQGEIEKQLHWDSKAYGWYTGAYGWLNVFLFFLIIGGIILDKMGARFSGLLAAVIMVCGSAVNYWAVATHSLDGQTWHILFWTFPSQVWMASLGYAIFGVGVEIAGITVSKIIVKWFTGHELALAMGMQLAIARLGTALALAISLPIALATGSLTTPLLLCLIMLVIGLGAFFYYTLQDKKLDASLALPEAQVKKSSDEEFHLKDLLMIMGNRGWWYISILCSLFYSAVFPFLKFATNFMIIKFRVPPEYAGAIPSLLPFGTILLTPFFGNLYDRKGKGASIMIIGSLLIILVHSIFAIPFLDHWIIAIALMIVLGIGFSLVPSAMWPSVPKIIPHKQLGSAYAAIFWLQNATALMTVPALIGWFLNKYCIKGEMVRAGATITIYDYTRMEIIFTVIGLLSLVFAILLKREDRKKDYGLESPNIKSVQ